MKYSPIFIILVLLSSCKSNSSFTEDAITFDKFPSNENLKLKVYKEISNIVVDGILNYKDSLLILRNAPNTSKYHFSVFDINKKNITASLLGSGRKENQSIAFLSYGIYEDKLWVNDIIKNKIITVQIENGITNDSIIDNTMSTFYYGIQLLNHGAYLASGDYDSEDRLTIIDSKTNTPVKSINKYPKGMTRGQKMAYESFLFVNPMRNMAVLAARFNDRIQIIDLKTTKSNVLRGPENFEPSFDIIKGQDNKEIIYSNNESRYGFVKGTMTNNFIYLLYSGNNQEGSNFHYGKMIYVYNWEGKPIKRYVLPHYVLDFTISSDDSVIYTYNPNSSVIEFSKLDL